MIEVKNLFFSYNSIVVLEDINFSLSEGVFAGLIGPNGGGKTTLLKLILGLYKPQKGYIKVFGKDSYKLGKERYKIGYIPQIKNINYDFPVNLIDFVLMGLYGKLGFFKSPQKKDIEYALNLLDLFNLSQKKNDNINTLSGGQLQKAYIARALITKPLIMLFDEPTIGLDAISLNKFYDFVIDIKKIFSLTVIMVSHEVDILNAKTDLTLCINKKLHFHESSNKLNIKKLGDFYSCELKDFENFKNKLKVLKK